MASPPNPSSPAAMSPPGPSAPQLPAVKKRSSTFDINGPNKRRKASSTSNNLIHPLRQTSFPPEARSPFPRSPSVDSASHVSGSQVSGVTANGAPKKKRGRKAKNAKGGGESATPSLVGGKAATSVSGHGGEDKDAEEEDEDDDKAEMALEDVGARTQEQKQEEIRLRAMLVEAFDPEQYSRYEHWRAMKLTESVVKRVVNATVSQSVPGMVTTAVKAVTKLFSGDIIELARQVQGEYIRAGERQSDLPTPPRSGAEGDAEEDAELHRGPLRPEHLREAWRRYKLAGESRGVGMQQLWHHQKQDGVERFSTKTGKRMFK